MTIITKSSTGKKEDIGVLPLFHAGQPRHQPGTPIIVAERRVNYPCRAVFFLILVALTVLSFGIIGSSILARFYGNQHTERMRFQCRLPYRSEDLNRQALINFGSDSDLDELRLANTLDMDWMTELSQRLRKHINDDELSIDGSDESDDDEEEEKSLLEKFFTERVDLEIGSQPDDEGVTKIDVPDFKDGRTGRFLHDFMFNQTAIVDTEERRCFLMPLDREMVLAPTSFRDLMMKMLQGKYDLDMSVIQKNMRVVLPAMDDFSEVSPRIMSDCKAMRMYKLEKFVHGVFKRSAELETDAKFGVFVGHLMQYDLHNMNEVVKYEEKVKALAEEEKK